MSKIVCKSKETFFLFYSNTKTCICGYHLTSQSVRLLAPKQIKPREKRNFFKAIFAVIVTVMAVLVMVISDMEFGMNLKQIEFWVKNFNPQNIVHFLLVVL